MAELSTYEQRLSLTEWAHRSIRKYILNGTIGPEDRLTEDFFARRLGISKSPIREALNTLQGEGLLRIEARRGTYLRRFDAQEVCNLYGLREALEGFAVVHARLSPELLAELADSLKRTRQLLLEGDKANYIDEDARFHGAIVAAAGNEEVLQVYGNVQNKLWLCRCQTFQLTSPDTPESHGAILEALERHDRAAAAAALRRHVRFVRDALVERLREQEKMRKAAVVEGETVEGETVETLS